MRDISQNPQDGNRGQDRRRGTRRGEGTGQPARPRQAGTGQSGTNQARTRGPQHPAKRSSRPAAPGQGQAAHASRRPSQSQTAHRTRPTVQGQHDAERRVHRDRGHQQNQRRQAAPMPQLPTSAQRQSAARRQAISRRGPGIGAGSLPLALAAVAVVAVLGIGIGAVSCIRSASDAEQQAQQEQEAQPTTYEPTSVHFVAVGDNLPEDQIGAWADAQAGTTGDGLYDYTALYAPIKNYIESADFAYVKEETHCGGDDIGPKGYPSFNTTDAMADAIVSTGFDLVASASNHSYDWGYFGANDHSCELWKTRDVVFTGTADCAEDAAKIATIEKNGITFALLDYTYGVNGYEQSDLPSYAVNFIDKDRIASDVAAAKQQADVVLMAMHWGTENLMEADETQLEYAQYLADLGVDVVLGSHPHVIGPMRWVEGKAGNQTLVAYSLGNFVSRHEAPSPKNELEGMLSCDFVRAEDGTVSVQNVVWTPLVNHTDGETFAVYALKDYTNELAAQDSVFSGLDDPVAWLRETSAEVVGGGFDIDA